MEREEYYNKFIEINEEEGWDSCIEWLEKQTKLTEELRDLIDLYWHAYKYMKNGDYDGGLCYELREKAITKITKILEGLE